MTNNPRERAAASEPRERSAPAKRRTRERVGESEGQSPSGRIDRREAIRRTALLAGVALAPDWLEFAVRAQAPAARTYVPAALGAVLRAAAERILPRTDTPGAIDAGVPAFIDRFFGEFMTADERKLLAGVLDEIDRAARAAHNASFALLPPAQQDAVLRGIAVAQQAQTSSGFGLLRSVTVLGYFSSEQVGKKVLNYDPVPGRYDGCVPIDQVGRRNWTT